MDEPTADDLVGAPDRGTRRPAGSGAPSRRAGDRLLALVALLISLAALHFARPVALPFVTGLFIAAVAWPLQQRLRRRLPRPLALLLTVLAVSTVLLALLGAIGWSTAAIAADLRERSERIEALQRRASAAAARVGLDVPPPGRGGGGGAPDDGRAGGGGPGGGSGGRLAMRVGIGVYTTIGYLALAVGFAALVLAELRALRERLHLRFGAARAGRAIAIADEVARSIRRYLKVKSITSGIAGAATGVLALLFGIKFAAVWALLAFLFEYVPTIGSLLAVVPPVAYAFVQFDGVAKPLAALAAFTVVQLFLGNYVDPRIEGRLLSISPVVVLLAIVFWAWLWGAPGSLLGVPIVVAITVVARHFAATRWVWALLTEPDEEEDEADGSGG